MRLVSVKKIYLEIATRKFNIFMLSKTNFETHFSILLRPFYQGSVHFTAINYYCTNIKVWKVLFDLFKIKYTEYFYSSIFCVPHTTV